MKIDLTKKEIGVILDILDQKMSKEVNDETIPYNKALSSAYQKLFKKERD